MYIIFLLALLLGFGIYEIVTIFVILPSKSTIKAINRLTEKKSISQELKEFFVIPIATLISKMIKFSSVSRERMQRNLDRVGIMETPEMYYANAITVSLWIAVSSLFLIPLGLNVMMIATVLLAVVMYFKNIDTVNTKLKDINNAIKQELPRFVRMYNHSRGDNVQFVDIVEKYNKIAGDKFKYDLEMLIMDLKTGNEENALLNFAERVNISQVTNFVNVILGSIKGDDMGVALQLMEGEMKALSRENKRRIMQERPGKVKRATMATGAMLLIMYFFVLGMDLIQNTAFFR